MRGGGRGGEAGPLGGPPSPARERSLSAGFPLLPSPPRLAPGSVTAREFCLGVLFGSFGLGVLFGPKVKTGPAAEPAVRLGYYFHYPRSSMAHLRAASPNPTTLLRRLSPRLGSPLSVQTAGGKGGESRRRETPPSPFSPLRAGPGAPLHGMQAHGESAFRIPKPVVVVAGLLPAAVLGPNKLPGQLRNGSWFEPRPSRNGGRGAGRVARGPAKNVRAFLGKGQVPGHP